MFLSESCFRIIPRVIFFSSIPYHYKTLMRSPGSFSYIKQGNIPFPSAKFKMYHLPFLEMRSIVKILVGFKGYADNHSREYLFDRFKKAQINVTIQDGVLPYSARAMEHKVLQRFYCFRKSFAAGYQRIQTEQYLMFFSSSSWRVSLNNYFQIPGPQCNLFKDNIADVFTQRIEFSVFCT